MSSKNIYLSNRSTLMNAFQVLVNCYKKTDVKNDRCPGCKFTFTFIIRQAELLVFVKTIDFSAHERLKPSRYLPPAASIV
ncbi:hypothetical protein XELAEV_18009752mg [Xenopus laevis]|uniref:Uncharacterized protein n=1 Tax=Xenopus laevis TaxID=8355 RepID=A0A974DSX9_XENLA|nr:hypothetical protein XELAEV_18009752mg [Xenopus laevis]